MTLVMYVVVTALVTTGLFLGIRYFVRAYLRYRDSRIIICPGNGEAAIVEVDAVHAALTPHWARQTSGCKTAPAGPSIKVAGRNACSSLT